MRKILLSTLAVVTLGFGFASQASAQGFHGGFYGGHRGGNHHHGGFRPAVSPFMFGIGAPMFISAPAPLCEIRHQVFETPYGLKKRRVRVCY